MLGCALALSSCSTAAYLFQAGRGQLEITSRTKPIPELVRDERTSPRLKTLLGEIPSIKAFGERNGLKATSNYTEYVALDRAAASWVVSACEPLSFKAKEWRFPLVGSFPYLGWFDLNDAKTYAEELRQREGLDVDVRGAAAYSTLGWFRDPVLSTMIPSGTEALGALVNVVLHESVHATFYINGQSYFDESIASFVADRIAPSYLEQVRGEQHPETLAYLKAEEQAETRTRRLHETYQQLEALYASAAPDAEKLRRKAEILGALKSELGFKRDINNATLVQYKTYNVGTAEFAALYEACGKDWTRFWKAIGRLDEGAFSSEQQLDLAPVLNPLISSGC